MVASTLALVSFRLWSHIPNIATAWYFKTILEATRKETLEDWSCQGPWPLESLRGPAKKYAEEATAPAAKTTSPAARTSLRRTLQRLLTTGRSDSTCLDKGSKHVTSVSHDKVGG